MGRAVRSVSEIISTPRQPICSRLLQPFRRITSSGDYIGEIDGLRFVAILFVYLYHLFGDILKHSPDVYKEPLKTSIFFVLALNLRIGVQLFFVISGFILALPFASHYLSGTRPIQTGKYFLRRLTRLEPPYVLSMLLFFVLKLAAARGSASELLPHLAASLAYLHNAIFGGPSVISIVAWSLEIEIQFYLLAPILATVFLIRSVAGRRLLLAMACLGFSVADALWGQNPLLRLSLLGSAQYFLVGFLLADFFVSCGRIRKGDWRWDMAALAGWPGLAMVLVSQGPWSRLLIPWLALLLYQSAFHGVWMNRLFNNLWLTTIGGMCYSIYLLHNYAISILGTYTESIGATAPVVRRLLLQFSLITPIVLGVCAIYFVLIEKPFMQPDWPQRLAAWMRSRPSSAVALVTVSESPSAD